LRACDELRNPGNRRSRQKKKKTKKKKKKKNFLRADPPAVTRDGAG